MSRAPKDEPNRAQVDLKQEGEIRGLADPRAEEEEMIYGCGEKSSAPPPLGDSVLLGVAAARVRRRGFRERKG
jgi:hypothetical protein